MDESYSLTSARAKLGELVSRARYSHRPVAITEHGKPSVAIINIDDLADLEDPAALDELHRHRAGNRAADAGPDSRRGQGGLRLDKAGTYCAGRTTAS